MVSKITECDKKECIHNEDGWCILAQYGFLKDNPKCSAYESEVS